MLAPVTTRHPVERFLPPLLREPGPREILWWQWLAFPIVVFVSWLVGAALGRITVAIALRLARRTTAKWDDELVARLRSPVTLAWTIVVAQMLMSILRLAPEAQLFVDQVLHAGLFVAFFWGLMRAVDVGALVAAESGWAHSYPHSRSLVPLATRVGKVAVVAIAVVAVLAEFGYPVASLIAGLGIGGLAVALAAQKTLENLFGAFAIGVDQPFHEGDFVKIGDLLGTVEEVGLRSTRIRSLDRTVVSIPNGKLAEMQLETYAPRDRFKLTQTLRLDHATTAAQVRAVIAGVEAALKADPKLFGTPTVRFTAIGEQALTVEIFSYLSTTDDAEFQRIRERLLLDFLAAIERAGARLAYPRRIVEQASDKAPSPR